MNRIYKLKFNRHIQQLTVVSELATNTVAKTDCQNSSSFSKGMKSLFTSCILLPTALAGLGISSSALANTDISGTHNQLGTVVAGTASSVTEGLVTTIKNSPNAIINWQSFNINQNEILKFVQNTTDSAVLNRIVGKDVSKILGSLQSNGQVFVVNPNGIIFGKNSQVNVGGLVASTLDINNKDFLNGRYVFNKDKDHAITQVLNSGVIKVNADSSLALIGGQVLNNGVLEARNGTVFLLAGNSIEIADLTNPQVFYKVTAKNKAVNLGRVFGKNAVLLGNKVLNGNPSTYAGNTFADVIGSSDTNANQASINADGSVTLFGGSEADTFQSTDQTNAQVVGTRNGGVINNGVINVSNIDGKAGMVKVLGDIVIADAHSQILATGNQGGKVVIGGDATGKGTVKLAQITELSANQQVNISGQKEAGNVVVWGGNTKVNGEFKAVSTNGQGGFIETSGHVINFGKEFSINLSASNNQDGTWLIDPDNLAVVGAVADLDQVKGKELGTSGVTFPDSHPIAYAETTVTDETYLSDAATGNSYIEQSTLNNAINSGATKIALNAKQALYLYNVTFTDNKLKELYLYENGDGSVSSSTVIQNSKFNVNNILNVTYGTDGTGKQYNSQGLYITNSSLGLNNLIINSLKEANVSIVNQSNVTANITFSSKVNKFSLENSSYNTLYQTNLANVKDIKVINSTIIADTYNYIIIDADNTVELDQLTIKENRGITKYNLNITGGNNVTIKNSKFEENMSPSIYILSKQGSVILEDVNITISNTSTFINITSQEDLIINNSNISANGLKRYISYPQYNGNEQINLKTLGTDKPVSIMKSIISVNGTLAIDSQADVKITDGSKLESFTQYNTPNSKNGKIDIKTTKTLTVDGSKVLADTDLNVTTGEDAVFANKTLVSSNYLNVSVTGTVTVDNSNLSHRSVATINGTAGVNISHAELNGNGSSLNVNSNGELCVTNSQFNNDSSINLNTTDQGNINIIDQAMTGDKLSINSNHDVNLTNTSLTSALKKFNATTGNISLNQSSITSKTGFDLNATQGSVKLNNSNISVSDENRPLNVNAKTKIEVTNNSNITTGSISLQSSEGPINLSDSLLNATSTSVKVISNKTVEVHNTLVIANNVPKDEIPDIIILKGEEGLTVDQGSSILANQGIQLLSNNTITVAGTEDKSVSVLSSNGTVYIATDTTHLIDHTAATGKTINLEHVNVSGLKTNIVASDKIITDKANLIATDKGLNLTADSLDLNNTQLLSNDTMILNATTQDTGSVLANNTVLNITNKSKSPIQITAVKDVNLTNVSEEGTPSSLSVTTQVGDINTDQSNFTRSTIDFNATNSLHMNSTKIGNAIGDNKLVVQKGDLSLTNGTDINTLNKKLELKSEHGNVTILASNLTGTGIAITSEKYLNISQNSKIVSHDQAEGLDLVSSNAAVTIDESQVFASNTSTVINITAKDYVNITNNSNITGNNDINIKNLGENQSNIESSIISANAAVSIDTGTAKLAVADSNVSSKNKTIDIKAGDVTLDNTTTKSVLDTNISADNVTVVNASNIQATHNLTVTAKNNATIVNSTLDNLGKGNLNITANKVAIDESHLKSQYEESRVLVKGTDEVKLTNATEIIAKKSVDISSDKKIIAKGGDDVSKAIMINATNGIVNITTDSAHVYDHQDITGKDTILDNAKISGTEVNLIASNNLNTNKVDVNAREGVANLTADSLEINQTNIVAKSNIVLNATTTDTGSITANGTNFNPGTNTELTAEKDINLENTTFNGTGIANLTATKGDINTDHVIFNNAQASTLVAQGSTNLNATVLKPDLYKIEAKTGNITLANGTDLHSTSDLALESKANITVIKSNLTSDGNVSLSAKNSVSVTDGSQVTANGSAGVNLASTEQGSVEVKDSNLTADKTKEKGVILNAVNGVANLVNSNISTMSDINISATGGNTTLDKVNLKPTDDSNIEITGDAVKVNNSIGKAHNITVTSSVGENNIIDSNLTAVCGINLVAEGNLGVNNSNFTGPCKIITTSKTGSANLDHATATSTDGIIDVTAKKDITITNKSNLEAKAKISIIPQDGIYTIDSSNLHSLEKEIDLSSSNGVNSITDSSALTDGCQVILPDDLGKVSIKNSTINTCRELSKPVEPTPVEPTPVEPKPVISTPVKPTPVKPVVGSAEYYEYDSYDNIGHRNYETTMTHHVGRDAGLDTTVNYISGDANIPNNLEYVTESCTVDVPRILSHYGILAKALTQEGLKAKYHVEDQDYNRLVSCQAYRVNYSTNSNKDQIFSSDKYNFTFPALVRYGNKILNPKD